MQITASNNQINEIGYVGEHYANELLVDISDISDGTLIAEYQTPKYEKLLSGTLEVSGNNAIVPLPESVMRYAGTVYIQVVSSVYDGEDITQIDKSDRFECVVKDSVQGDDTAWHDDADGLLLQLNETLATLQQSNYIPCYTAFPDNPSEGDIVCITQPATISANKFGFVKDYFTGDISSNGITPYIHKIDMPIPLSINIDLTSAPILDDTLTTYYGLTAYNLITNVGSVIAYGYNDGIADKPFLYYEKMDDADTDYVTWIYTSEGTVLDNSVTVPATGWYLIVDDNDTFDIVPLSEVNENLLTDDMTKVDITYLYDMFYSGDTTDWTALTDEIFNKFGNCISVELNSGLYKYTGGKWVDLNYNGLIERYVEDRQN